MGVAVTFDNDGIPEILSNTSQLSIPGKTIDQNFNVNNWKEYNLLSGPELKKADFNNFFNPTNKHMFQGPEKKEATDKFNEYKNKLNELKNLKEGKPQYKKFRGKGGLKNTEPKDFLSYFKITKQDFETLTREEQRKYMAIGISFDNLMRDSFLASQNTPVLEENIITNQIPGVKSIKVKYEGEL